MIYLRRPNGELQLVPCSACIKESAAAQAGHCGRPWLEVCPGCGHYLTPGKDCLVCRLQAASQALAGSADGHYVSVYAERKES